MRHRWPICGLVCALLAGCVTSETGAARRAVRMRPFQAAQSDTVIMDVAMLERPVGDHYINQDFWDSADEQVVPAEQRGVIEDNGFRVGQVGAVPPAGLHDLLSSRRSCPDPRRIQTHAGTTTRLPIGSHLPDCQYFLHADGRATSVDLHDADCALLITASLTDDGRTCLQFVPQVQHGSAALMPAPAADRSGWELSQQRPAERYPHLGWQVVLAPGELAIVSARYDRPDSLGHRMFIRTDAVPIQRMIVIRSGRTQPPAFGGSEEDAASRRAAPSLACQASSTGEGVPDSSLRARNEQADAKR